MEQEDVRYADESLNSFIYSSINRVSENGVMSHKYRISAAEIKEETNRMRLKQAVIDDYISYFAEHNVAAEYKEASESISITLNLADCVLNSRQARDLADAMSLYRVENT